MTANHQSTPSRGRTPRVLLAAALVLAVAAAVFVLRQDNPASQPPAPAPTPPPATAPPTTLDPEKEVVARLREILRIRHRAFAGRHPELLQTIYTSDCPCFEGDRNAIEELVSKKYVLLGGSTSVTVHRTQRISDRLWFITATFSSEPARVETESGRLIRKEPPGRDLTQFALAKPPDSTEWLLGRATPHGTG